MEESRGFYSKESTEISVGTGEEDLQLAKNEKQDAQIIKVTGLYKQGAKETRENNEVLSIKTLKKK